MVPIDALVSLDLNDILDIEPTAVAAIKSGGVVTTWGAAGSTVTKLADGKPSEVLKACDFAKRTKWPQIYGAIRSRTVVGFGKGTC